jgi:hypothetical protein
MPKVLLMLDPAYLGPPALADAGLGGRTLGALAATKSLRLARSASLSLACTRASLSKLSSDRLELLASISVPCLHMSMSRSKFRALLLLLLLPPACG